MKKIFLLLLLAIISCGVQKRTPIILISIDNLSPNYIKNMPNLLNFSKEGISFENCFTPYPLCLPAHISILTSKSPIESRCFLNEFYYLKKEIKTLPQILKERGYRTYGFVSGKPLKKISGINRGFDLYNDLFLQTNRGNLLLSENLKKDIYLNYRKAEDTFGLALNFILNEKRPFFLFLHIFDGFPPFLPPENFSKKHSEDPYLASIEYIDFEIGKFFNELKNKNIYEKSLIIITSDHGKIEKEEESGFNLKIKDIKVPLIIKYPARYKNKITDTKGNFSISSIPGFILSYLNNKEIKLNEEIFSFTFIPYHLYGEKPKFSMVEKGFKYDFEEKIKIYKINDLGGNELNESFDENKVFKRFQNYYGELLSKYNSTNEEFYPSIMKANELLKENKIKEALEILNKFYKTHQENETFLKALLFAKKKERDLKGIENVIEIFEKNFGSSPFTELEKYILILNYGERDKALQFLYDLMKKYQPFSFYINEALSIEKFSNLNEFENFLKKIPSDVDYYFKLIFEGMRKLFEKSEKDAFLYFEEAIENGAEIPLPFFQAGIILKREGKIREAIPYIYASHILFPENQRFLYELGDSFAILGDFEKAYIFFKKAYEIDKNNFSVNISYLKICYLLNKKDEFLLSKEYVLKNFKNELADLIKKDKMLNEIISSSP